jgi:hypothetical protein
MPLFFNCFCLGKLLAAAATILFVLPLGSTLADKPAHGFAKTGFLTKSSQVLSRFTGASTGE